MDIRPLQRHARYICLSVCKEKQRSSASQNCIHDFLHNVHVFCDILATFTTRFHCTWSHLIIRDFSHPWKDLGNKCSSKWIKIPITTSSQIFTNQLMYKILPWYWHQLATDKTRVWDLFFIPWVFNHRLRPVSCWSFRIWPQSRPQPISPLNVYSNENSLAVSSQ